MVAEARAARAVPGRRASMMGRASQRTDAPQSVTEWSVEGTVAVAPAVDVNREWSATTTASVYRPGAARLIVWESNAEATDVAAYAGCALPTRCATTKLSASLHKAVCPNVRGKCAVQISVLEPAERVLLDRFAITWASV